MCSSDLQNEGITQGVFVFTCVVVPMMPLTGKERRKYLEALKEKNVGGEHISSVPVGLLLRKGKKEQGTTGETSGGDASGSTKGAAEDVIDLAGSPPKGPKKYLQ